MTVQRQILDHLDTMTTELGTAVLLITHDLGLAAERADQVVVMYRGQVVESGPSLELLQNPQHPYTQRLVASAPSLASRRIQAAKELGVETDDMLAPSETGVVEPAKSDDVLQIQNLRKVFKLRSGLGKSTDFTAVDDVSFSVKRGTTTAIVGESGSGKSTVAQMVLNLLTPTSGKIIFDGVDTSTLNSKEIFAFRRRVQPIFQDPYGSLDPMYNIFRTIEEPLRTHKIGDKASREKKVRELLDQVALPQSTMQRYPNELSGGQRQRVAIARALALDPEVIICDEAVSALDVLVQAQVLNLLAELQSRLGLTYLFITHDLAVVRQIADHVCVMEKGKLVEPARRTTSSIRRSRTTPGRCSTPSPAPASCCRRKWPEPPGLAAAASRWPARSRCPPLEADTGSFVRLASWIGSVSVPGAGGPAFGSGTGVPGAGGSGVAGRSRWVKRDTCELCGARSQILELQAPAARRKWRRGPAWPCRFRCDAVRHRAGQVVPGEPVAGADERQPVLGPRPVPKRRPPRSAGRRRLGAARECADHEHPGGGVTLLDAGDQPVGVGDDLRVGGAASGVVPAAFDHHERRSAVREFPVAALERVDVVAGLAVGRHESGAAPAAEEDFVAGRGQALPGPAVGRFRLGVANQHGRTA